MASLTPANFLILINPNYIALKTLNVYKCFVLLLYFRNFAIVKQT